VRVSGSTKDLPLLTAIALEVEKAGGASFFALSSDESVRRTCHEVPAERDAGNAAATLKLISAMTADISVSSGSNPGLCSDVDPARLAARGKAFQEANAAYTKGGIKAINLGNGMEPADWRAKRFGITPAQLSSLYWNGISVEPAKLKEAAAPIIRGLAGETPHAHRCQRHDGVHVHRKPAGALQRRARDSGDGQEGPDSRRLVARR
jgi:leucyl aminopeptidase (aminopeptidase T)